MAMLESAQSSASFPEWLELVEGDSSVLLIAPHAGRAGEASRARLHPKVNDLHTREITLDLARRLNATALINHGMDRNRLDCNRLEQLVAASPEFLDLILERTQRIIDK